MLILAITGLWQSGLKKELKAYINYSTSRAPKVLINLALGKFSLREVH